jgi:hypothetical protein
MRKTIFFYSHFFICLFASANEVESNTIILIKQKFVGNKGNPGFKEELKLKRSPLLFEFCIIQNKLVVGTVRLMDGNPIRSI